MDNFKGFEVIKHDDATLSVMAPYRNHRGLKEYRAEGRFATHAELRDYVHENCMKWMDI